MNGVLLPRMAKKGTPNPKSRKAIDAKLSDLRKAVAEVQRHLDDILSVCAEAEKLRREHIRCEPRSLGRASKLAGTVAASVRKSWEKSRPSVF